MHAGNITYTLLIHRQIHTDTGKQLIAFFLKLDGSLIFHHWCIIPTKYLANLHWPAPLPLVRWASNLYCDLLVCAKVEPNYIYRDSSLFPRPNYFCTFFPSLAWFFGYQRRLWLEVFIWVVLDRLFRLLLETFCELKTLYYNRNDNYFSIVQMS